MVFVYIPHQERSADDNLINIDNFNFIMGWKDWSYKIKGGIISVILFFLLYIISFILQQNLYAYYFRLAFFYELISFTVLGFFIGWVIDSFKKDNSATNKSLKIGLFLFACVIVFMLLYCTYSIYYGTSLAENNYLKCISFNFTINNGWLALFLAILIPTIIGFIIDKIKRRENKSREIWLSMLFAGVILVIILGSYGLGSFFYSDSPTKCKYYSDKDSCYSEVALSLVNQGRLQISLCEKIQNDALKYKCYTQLAGQNKDLQVCENIHYLPTRDKCIGNLAVVRNDVSICDKAQKEFKEECLIWVSQGGSSY